MTEGIYTLFSVLKKAALGTCGRKKMVDRKETVAMGTVDQTGKG